MTSPARTVIESYFRALETEDEALLATVFHPELELVPVGSRPRTGCDSAIAFLRKVFERFPDHHDTPTRIIEAGDVVVVEIAFRGTTAEGRSVTFDALDVFDLLDGRIVKLVQWFDTAGLAAQLARPVGGSS